VAVVSCSPPRDMDLADGERAPASIAMDTGQSFETYLEKSYCKTASLIANSARPPRAQRAWRWAARLANRFAVSWPGLPGVG